MYIEALQESGYLSQNVDLDGWDYSRVDVVVLHAADYWLRRTWLAGGDIGGALAPELQDVQVAGASGDCSIWVQCGRSADGGKTTEDIYEVFLFAGDLQKWSLANGTQLGASDSYLDFASELAEAAAEKWGLEGTDRFTRLQALIWSIQTARVRDEHRDYREAVDAVQGIAERVGLRSMGIEA